MQLNTAISGHVGDRRYFSIFKAAEGDELG